MNNFYSANGDINNYEIIEHFNSPNEGVSIISHLLESEKQKNKIEELENKIKDLSGQLATVDVKIKNEISNFKKYLPYKNNRFSSINSKKSNDWNLEDDNLFIDITFENTYYFIPNIYTELILNKDYKLNFKKRIANLSKTGFRMYIKLLGFNLEDYNIKNNTNFKSDIDFLKSDLTLNYIVIS